jgi:hypothetical protein
MQESPAPTRELPWPLVLDIPTDCAPHAELTLNASVTMEISSSSYIGASAVLAKLLRKVPPPVKSWTRIALLVSDFPSK